MISCWVFVAASCTTARPLSRDVEDGAIWDVASTGAVAAGSADRAANSAKKGEIAYPVLKHLEFTLLSVYLCATSSVRCDLKSFFSVEDGAPALVCSRGLKRLIRFLIGALFHAMLIHCKKEIRRR